MPLIISLQISEVRVLGRSDGCCNNRIVDTVVEVLREGKLISQCGEIISREGNNSNKYNADMVGVGTGRIKVSNN